MLKFLQKILELLKAKPKEGLGLVTGFTLIEVLVVIGIMSVLAALGLIVTMDQYKSYAFNAERDLVVSLLQKARSRSLSNISQIQHGIYIDSENYVLYQGAGISLPYSCGSVGVECYPVSVGMHIIPQSFEVKFMQLSGSTVSAGNFLLSDGKRSAQISINPAGGINW